MPVWLNSRRSHPGGPAIVVGLPLSASEKEAPGSFVDHMFASLRDVRGISIVPACAALAVLGRRGLFDPSRLLEGEFDRAAFDGELGWALGRI